MPRTAAKPRLLDRKEGLYLKHTGSIKGRGVFCTRPIKKGEAIEVTPSLLLNENETLTVDQTHMVNYTFVTGDISAKLRKKTGIKDPEHASSVLFGVMTFCNHDEKPNAIIEWEEDDGTVYFTLRATRAIPKNTEICTTYGEGWFDDRA
ncbi:MAG: SET domain-containing protein [Alphaproteobacteria bacterium]|jgi:SET domain-containing protein